MTTRKLRWGILGCAGIAINSVIPGIQQSQTGEVAAIASRNLEKSQEAAAKLGIPQAYGSYEELLADDTIEAVYIPLPNHLHLEWTIRAAEAGKHILCEKPLALNAAEAQRMADACGQAGVHLAEAFMYRHHPRYEQIRQIIQSGKIGELRALHGVFTFNNAADHANIRYKRDMGGGSLYDVGCYPISAARLILGEEPVAATVHALLSPEHDNVDMMASGVLEFSKGMAVTFTCGMWADFRNTLEILGTSGRIEVPNAFVGDPNFYVITADGRQEEQPEKLNQYALQADVFARTVWNEVDSAFPVSDAVLNMKVLDACLKSAYEKVRVEL
ncbi:oxidoreductase [Paenibacillus swuensis]|uniref:Oxidoreductase n=1 Tax=Paenibacillus swuensis TaxID=1178515 RepID=A0A172TP13_9BACL|nr:oxidoreductase [Paenibacillus swuensis]